MPPMHEYQKYLDKIWQTRHLTNQGPILQEFEKSTKEYLGLRDFHFVANGTLALQVALHALNIRAGEIITTPFTYVATTSSILWERCTPVFVDIDKDSFCIDASKIEAAITPETKAILGVHVFGHPCDVVAIEKIARKHNLKVIYDAAHAFGAKYKGKSLLDYGDISVSSFHATKLFHTIEGGCIIAQDKEVSEAVELIKRFGHHGDEHVRLGINAKASEFQAAMGLCNLKYVDKIIKERKHLTGVYRRNLPSGLHTPSPVKNLVPNYAYMPVVFHTEARLLHAMKKLNQLDIYPRRYFYPSLNMLPYVVSRYKCPVSESISKRVMCLPLYPGLDDSVIKQICETI